MTHENPDLWFSELVAEIKQAKVLCLECPVRIECADQGFNDEHGVWGGLSIYEREKLKRNRR